MSSDEGCYLRVGASSVCSSTWECRPRETTHHVRPAAHPAACR